MATRQEIESKMKEQLNTALGIINGLKKKEAQRGSIIPEEKEAREIATHMGISAINHMKDIELEELRGKVIPVSDQRLKFAQKQAKEALKQATKAMDLVRKHEEAAEKTFLESFLDPFVSDFRARLEPMNMASRLGHRMPPSVRDPRERAVTLANEAVKEAYAAGKSPDRQRRALHFRKRAYEEIEKAERAFEKLLG